MIIDFLQAVRRNAASVKVSLVAVSICILHPSVGTAADHLVPANALSFDCAKAAPGDTITLAAGARGPLAIGNCKATASNPITIRNDANGSGPVVITSTAGTARAWVFTCTDCVGVTIDGSNKWVGAGPGDTYGIKVTMTGGTSPSGFVLITGLSRFITIKNVEIDGKWPEIATNGIGIHIKSGEDNLAADHPDFWYEGIRIEKNYVHNVEGEGMYIGPNWSKGMIPLRNVEIRDNLVEDTGWDGIQLKSSIQGSNSIHGNTLHRVGQWIVPSNIDGEHYGISLYEGNGKIYDNWVEKVGESGIQHYTKELPSSLPVQVSEIYNNVVIDTGLRGPLVGHGITVGNAPGAAKLLSRVYSNTVIRTQGAGINFNGNVAGGIVRDNIIAEAGSDAISIPSVVETKNNRIGKISEIGFVDPSRRDFHLRSDSPSRNSGSDLFPLTDINGVVRPQEGAADQGAYEYIQDLDKRPLPPQLEVIK